MTRFFIFGVLSLFIATTYVAASDLYSDRFDNVNIDEILKNPRVRKQYSMCYLGTAPCLTQDAKFFKETFAEAVATKCKRCTEKQKEIFEKIVVFYIKEEPMVWKMILGNILQGQAS